MFIANEQKVDLDEAHFSWLARHVLDEESVQEDAELSVLFVTADHMRRLNQRFAGNDYATDVLAFPMMEDDEASMLLGDVVVCPEVAARHSVDHGHSLDEEIAMLVIHGTLHLLGYDHDSQQQRNEMNDRAAEILASFDPAPGSRR